MGQVLLACTGSESRGMLCILLPMHPSPGLAMATLLILVEQRLPQTIAAAGRSHPKGRKLEQVGPYCWHRQPTCRNHRMKNPSEIAHTHLQTASSNHRLKDESCSKSPWPWTSKGKGKYTGETVTLIFCLSPVARLHKLKQTKATLHFRCQSLCLKCWCRVWFFYLIYCATSVSITIY